MISVFEWKANFLAAGQVWKTGNLQFENLESELE
jgi:hypothetical protein